MYMDKKLQRVEEKLHQKIEQVFKKGLYMNGGYALGVERSGLPSESTGCCLLGAAILGVERHCTCYILGVERHCTCYVACAATLLGVTESEVRRLETGYLGDWGSDDEFAKLGRKMRETYYETSEVES